MKASYFTKYGPPEVLEIRELPVPNPSSKEILVKVMASTVNSGDVRVRALDASGLMKFAMRLLVGWSRPKRPVLGVTFAGVVEKIGSEVTGFKPGDRVFGLTGFRFGCHATWLVAPENSMVAHMPEKTNFEDGVAVLFGGQTAVSFLHKMRLPEIKQAKVLILGATGSVGTAAIQLAKYYGAEVTAVCSTSGKSLSSGLGADHILCYDVEDFTKIKDRFDIILDAVGKYSQKQCKHLLKPNGKFKTVGGMEYASETRDQITLLAEMLEKNRLQPVIDKVYPLEEIREAHRYVETGRKKGNVVIRMAHG